MLVPLDSASGETSQRFPSLLPGNKVLLFTSKASTISTFDEAVIVAYRLDKRERKVIIRGGTCASYVPTGHLVYARGKSILAVPFDLDELEATGPPVQVLEGGMTNIGSGASEYAFSNSGVLAYVPGGPYAVDDNIVVMVDRQGHVEPLLDMARGYNEAALSPDGEKLTLTVLAANDDIWVYHTVRKTLARLTFGGGNHSRPLWTPDGKHVVYSSEVNGVPNVFKKVWDGSGAEERITSSPSAQFPGSWSPDGRILAIEEDGKIWMLFDGNQRKPELFLDSHFPVWDPTFAPDGKWLAYGSAESGRSEIYVVPFPKREGKWQVSTGGGVNPIWARNGKELFYVSDNKVMVVQVTTLSSFNASTPRVLFPFPPRAFELTDITPDGKKFIMLVGREQEPVSQVLNVVVGWFEELKKNFAARQ
jgi:serine/threonine-protein kinase